MVYCKKYFEIHNLVTLLWDQFLYEMFSKGIIKIVRIIIMHPILGHILEVLFHSFLVHLIIYNIGIVIAVTCGFLNNVKFTTINFVYTSTFLDKYESKHTGR